MAYPEPLEGRHLSAEQGQKLVRKEFRGEVEACEELRDFALDRMQPWRGREAEPAPGGEPPSGDELIALELGRSTKTFRAALELAFGGNGEQAAMLNRSLFEGMAVAHWIHENEGLAGERFHKAGRYSDHLTAGLMERVGWLDEIDADLESLKLDGAEVEELRKEFGRYGESMWTGQDNLRGLVKDIEAQWTTEESRRLLWDFLEVVHRDNNQLLHSTVAGLIRAHSRTDPGGLRLWAGPSNQHVSEALFGSHWIYANLFTLAMDRFAIPDREQFDAMQQRHGFDFFRFTSADVRNVGRNDKCPCGSGKKFKRCHWDQVHRA
jgi:SEC-C motif-containing protein/uncharacterized protein DUF5677